MFDFITYFHFFSLLSLSLGGWLWQMWSCVIFSSLRMACHLEPRATLSTLKRGFISTK